MDRGKLKARALSQLSGRWGMVILACFIYGLLMSGGSGVSTSINMSTANVSSTFFIGFLTFALVGSLLSLILFGPMQMGMSNYMFTFVRTGNTAIENLFDGFKNFVNSLKIGLWYALYMFLWVGLPMIVLMGVSFTMMFAAAYGANDGMIFLIMLVAMVGSIAISIFSLIKIIGYSAMFYIKLENPDQSGVACLKKSEEIMRGQKWDFFVLQLSFIGWGILCIFTLGIGFFWLTPYQKVTEANYFYELLARNNLLRNNVPNGAENNNKNQDETQEDWHLYEDDRNAGNFVEAGKEDWNTSGNEYWKEKPTDQDGGDDLGANRGSDESDKL